MVIEFGRERKLQLDCCTRWNSIENMLSVFLESLVPIKKTLLDLKQDFNLNAYEISIANDCLNILIPPKRSCLILSERNNDIVIAEQALNMLCDEYNKQDTFFSKQLCELIKNRYDERRDIRPLSIIYFFMYNETYLNNQSELKFNARDEIIKDIDELKKKFFPDLDELTNTDSSIVDIHLFFC